MNDLIDRNAFIRFISNIERENEDRLFTFEELKKMLRDAPAVNRCISVDDALPEKGVPVVCYMRSGQILVMELSDDDGWYCGITRYNPRAVSNWMPLPEPPEKE